MKKRFGAVLMAGLMTCTLAAGFAGCGVDGDGDINSDYKDLADVELSANGGFTMPEGGFDVTKPVEIKFYHTMGKVLREELEIELAEFQKLYPNITVKHEQVGNYDDVRDQISKEIIANNQPNIAYCYPDHVALYNRANAVQALNDFLPGGSLAETKIVREDGVEVELGLSEEERDMFIPGFYDEGHMFGDGTQMYTMPFAKSTEVLFYNKTFFDQHTEIKIPTTWDEMETACRQILEIDPDCIPFGYDSEANWFITMCEQYQSPYTSATGTRYRFDNETNRAFVARFQDWFKKGYFTTQAIYKSYTSGLFTSTSGQRCYMCIGSSAGAKNQQAPNTDGVYAFEVGITQIPQVNPEQPKVISQGPSVCIFKSEDPQEVIASWLLVKYLTTNVTFQAAFSLDSGYMPPLKMDIMKQNQGYADELNKANGTSGITALSSQQCLTQEKAYFTSPAFVGSSKARDEVGLLMQAVFTESKSLDQAFKDAIEECEYFS